MISLGPRSSSYLSYDSGLPQDAVPVTQGQVPSVNTARQAGDTHEVGRRPASASTAR